MKREDFIISFGIVCLCITFLLMFYTDNMRYHPYDVNHDGKVNITDYKLIKDYIQKEGN